MNFSYNDFDAENQRRLMEKKKLVIESKNIDDYKMVLMKKAIVILQKTYRMFKAKKNYYVKKIHMQVLINRIIRKVKKFLYKINNEKNNAAHKIQFLMKKNKDDNDMYTNIGSSAKGWLRKKDPSRNLAATIIQRYWRAYQEELLDLILDEKAMKEYKKNKMSNSLGSIKSLASGNKIKMCSICHIEKSSFLCKDVNLFFYFLI